MRLLLDGDIASPRILEPLAQAGHDVRSVGDDPAHLGLADEQVLELAAREGRILVTHNVSDFPEILGDWGRGGRSHAGCILVTLPTNSFGEIVSGLGRLLAGQPDPARWVDLARWLSRG